MCEGQGGGGSPWWYAGRVFIDLCRSQGWRDVWTDAEDKKGTHHLIHEGIRPCGREVGKVDIGGQQPRK